MDLVMLLIACLLLTLLTVDAQGDLPDFPTAGDPTLSGYHFRITVAEHDGWTTIEEDPTTGKLTFSGYLIDILRELSLRANFSYDLLTPSGYGSLCPSRLKVPNATLQTTATSKRLHHPDAYSKGLRKAYRCGESDVHDKPKSEYTTDMFWALSYITPDRLKTQKVTIPYSPPGTATLGMIGHATHIDTIHDLPGTSYSACAYEGTAYIDNLVKSFPELDVIPVSLTEDTHTLLTDTCDVIITAVPLAKQDVLKLYEEGKCNANGKPIGVIGEPLEYGFGYLGFTMRKDLPDEVLETLNFWLQALMACFPQDNDGYCPDGKGSLSQIYKEDGGRGDECGYVQYPTEPTKTLLPPAGIAAIVITPCLLIVLIGVFWHLRLLKIQEKRMKKRFIQQLARNIDIGPSARQISAAKLTEAFQHIGGQDGLICKQDLAKWMNDLNLDFLSERDFDRLWDTMDMDGTGYVDPIEFFQFLNECENQFQEVHEEYSSLPKSEKVKLASRRLSNIKAMGEEEVEKMERRNNRKSRAIQLAPSTKSTEQGSSSQLNTSTGTFGNFSFSSKA